MAFNSPVDRQLRAPPWFDAAFCSSLRRINSTLTSCERRRWHSHRSCKLGGRRRQREQCGAIVAGRHDGGGGESGDAGPFKPLSQVAWASTVVTAAPTARISSPAPSSTRQFVAFAPAGDAGSDADVSSAAAGHAERPIVGAASTDHRSRGGDVVACTGIAAVRHAAVRIHAG